MAIAARYPTLESMLSDFALEPPSDAVGGTLAAAEDESRLTLSTIHSAKGLEWHTVFLIWAADGKFPAPQSMLDDAELEEERRLCYVAVTRAKRLLYLCYPIQYFERGRLEFDGAMRWGLTGLETAGRYPAGPRAPLYCAPACPADSPTR